MFGVLRADRCGYRDRHIQDDTEPSSATIWLRADAAAVQIHLRRRQTLRRAAEEPAAVIAVGEFHYARDDEGNTSKTMTTEKWSSHY